MHTILIFLHRLPGTTPTAFRTHYETIHLPLLQSLAGPTFPQRHIRRYLTRSSDGPDYAATVLLGAQTDFEWDAVAEVVFESREAMMKFFGTVGQGEAKEKLHEDEARFMDRERLKVVEIGETVGTGA